MNSFAKAALAAASLVFAHAGPAMADDYPLKAGSYVGVGMVTIDDGHGLDYAKFLAGFWKDQEEFAKSQGWITSYEILANVDKRPGEPDLYLIERFPSQPDAAETARREAAYQAHMQKSAAQLESESGARASYRHVIGSQLLREMIIK